MLFRDVVIFLPVSNFLKISSKRSIGAICSILMHYAQAYCNLSAFFAIQTLWAEEKVPLWLKPYAVVVTSNESGFIEPIVDAVSLHQIKKHSQMSLLNYFIKVKIWVDWKTLSPVNALSCFPMCAREMF